MPIPSVQEKLERLLPSIRARREEIEAARQLPRDLAAEIRATGVYALAVPRAIGGGEATPAELLRLIESVAAADGSAGWCVMVGLGNNVAAGYMSEAGARQVFADPTLPTAGIAAPAGAAVRQDGGVRVSGRWAFASGITHCGWVWAGCLVTENGQPRMTPQGPEIVHVCLPVQEIEIHDTWRASGLRGTGSHDFSAADRFVPAERVFGLLDPRGHRSEPLYRMPPLGLFVDLVAAVALGVARAALDELAELAQSKTPTLYREVLADRPVAQLEIARADAALGAARAYLHEQVDSVWRTVLAGGEPSQREVARARGATSHAAETAAAVTRIANILGGGSSVYSGSSLQRHARDAEAIAHHFSVAPHAWEEIGRVLLGRQPNVPVL